MNKYDERKKLYKEVIEDEYRQCSDYVVDCRCCSIEWLNAIDRCCRLRKILLELAGD